MFRFSTDTFPERDRFPVFCEEMFRCMLSLDVARRDTAPFRGEIEVRRAGAVEIAKVTTSAAHYFRTRNLVRDGRDDLYAMLPRNGVVYTTQGSDAALFRPGMGAVCDSTQIGGIRVEDKAQYWALKIPRARIASLVTHTGHFGGMALNGDTTALGLLLGYLEGTLDSRLDGSSRAGEIFGNHLMDLVALALGSNGESRELIEQRSLRTVRRAAIFREIDAHLDDPELTAVKVAATLGITPRYVHLLLDETGQTFSELMLERRLIRIREMLRDPRQRERKIFEIAFALGFGDLSYFNRTFRRRFGMTPSEMRAARD